MSEVQEQVVVPGPAPVVAQADANEYEQKFLATSKLLEESKNQAELLDRKLGAYLAEVQQYLKDLEFWSKAHGNDYPGRRRNELLLKIEEIEGWK